jgi:hypothetical protein
MTSATHALPNVTANEITAGQSRNTVRDSYQFATGKTT